MGDMRKRVLVGGLFAICVAVTIYSLNEGDSPSLSWTTILCGMWSAGVWLWQPWMLPSKTRLAKLARVSAYIAATLLAGCLLIFWTRMFFASIVSKPEQLIHEQDAIALRDGFESLSKAQKSSTLEILARYAAQQRKLGLPIYPSDAFSIRTLDFLPAFENFDSWVSTLPEGRKKLIETRFAFTPPEALEEDRKNWLNVALISQRTGRGMDEVTRNLETFYIPAFAKHEKGLKLAVPPKDSNEFYDAAKEMLLYEHKTSMPGMLKPRHISNFPTAPK
jgi:hypothetical protein